MSVAPAIPQLLRGSQCFASSVTLESQDCGADFRGLVVEALASSGGGFGFVVPDDGSRNQLLQHVESEEGREVVDENLYPSSRLPSEIEMREDLALLEEQGQLQLIVESQPLPAVHIERLPRSDYGDLLNERMQPPPSELSARGGTRELTCSEEFIPVAVSRPNTSPGSGISFEAGATAFHGVLRVVAGASSVTALQFPAKQEGGSCHGGRTETFTNPSGTLEVAARIEQVLPVPELPEGVGSLRIGRVAQIGEPGRGTRVERTVTQPSVMRSRLLNRTDFGLLDHGSSSLPGRPRGSSANDRAADLVSDPEVSSVLEEPLPVRTDGTGPMQARESRAFAPVGLLDTSPRIVRVWNSFPDPGVTQSAQVIETAIEDPDSQPPASDARLRLLNLQVVTEAGSRVQLRLAVDREVLRFSAATSDLELGRSLRCELTELKAQLQKISSDVMVTAGEAPAWRDGESRSQPVVSAGESRFSSGAEQDPDRRRGLLLDAWGESIEEERYRRNGSQQKEVWPE